MKLAANNDFFQKEASSENWLFFLEQLFFGMSWKYEDILTLFLTQFTPRWISHARIQSHKDSLACQKGQLINLEKESKDHIIFFFL